MIHPIPGRNVTHNDREPIRLYNCNEVRGDDGHVVLYDIEFDRMIHEEGGERVSRVDEEFGRVVRSVGEVAIWW